MIFYTALVVLVISIMYWYLQAGIQDTDDIHNPRINKTYDYVIVGAGSAGAIIATRLSEDPDISVLLLEAGGSELMNNNIRYPEMAGSLIASSVDWGHYTVPQKYSQLAMNDQKAYWPSGRVLGGSSSINFMTYVRGSRYDYNKWAAEGCKGWSYKDVLPYFMKIEDVQIPELSNSSYRGRSGNVPLTDSRYQNPTKLFTAAAGELGWETVDYNGKDMLGFSYVQYNVLNGERYSSAKAYLRPVVHRNNLHINVNAFATKILMNGNRATGIEFIKDNRKTTVNIRKEVIVSAGAVMSPVLLMLSGIGPRKHLEKLNIPVITDLPVGENLQNHIFFPLDFSVNESLAACEISVFSKIGNLFWSIFNRGRQSCHVTTTQYYGKNKDKDDNSELPEFQIVVLAVPEDKGLINIGLPFNIKPEINAKLRMQADEKEFTLLNVLLHPKSRGSIRLKSIDPFDDPLIDPNFLQHSDDLRTLVRAIRQSQKFASVDTLQKIRTTVKDRRVEGICDQEVFDSDSYWECHIRHFALTMWQPTSTCRMGDRGDKTAVVDPELRVHGVQGLRVADCSVLRNLPSGNTNAPCMMVGEKAADLIRRNTL